MSSQTIETPFGALTLDSYGTSYEGELPFPLFEGYVGDELWPFPPEDGVFGQAEYEEHTKLPELAGDSDDGGTEVCINIEEGEAVADYQLETLRFVAEHAADIEKAVLAYLPEPFEFFIPEHVDQGDGFRSPEDEARYVKCLEFLGSGEALKHYLTSPRVDILMEKVDGVGSYALNFNCGWDDEHGMALLMNGTRVLEWAGSSGYYDR